jgi:hypothetical protein
MVHNWVVDVEAAMPWGSFYVDINLDIASDTWSVWTKSRNVLYYCLALAL